MGRWRPAVARTCLGLAAVSLLVLATACSRPARATPGAEDTTYLTPIPEATLVAFQAGAPIETRLQAAIAARASLGSTRLSFAAEPKVVSVEELNLAEAHQRVTQPGVTTYEDRPAEARVWLVFFESDWQVIPPDPGHTVTPPPPAHGCVYVLLQASDAGRTEVGTIACPASSR